MHKPAAFRTALTLPERSCKPLPKLRDICRVVRMASPRALSAQTRSVLNAMANEPARWLHGYSISKATGLKSGTLYPLLMRLSDQGHLESRWEQPERPGRPARHAYRLTASGLALAREHREALPSDPGVAGLVPA